MVKNWNQFSYNKNISYSAVVLDKKSHDKLINLISGYEILDDWKKFAHHMTLNMGELNNQLLLGKKVELKVTGINDFNESDKSVAVRVETDLPVKSGNPHITLAVNIKIGGKPKDSINIKEWKDIDNFNVYGIVEEVPF